MNRLLSCFAAVLAIVAAIASAGAKGGQATVAAPARPQLVDPRSESAGQVLANPDQFGWQMFLYVDWPEFAGERGVPDIKRFIGDAGPTVWESYKNVSEVYQANGQRPVAWEIDDELPPVPSRHAAIAPARLAALGPVDSHWIHFLAEPTMIDGQQICDSASEVLRYDVRGDRSYYDYVVNNISGHQLYNVQGQQAALADPNFTFTFPTTTLEVKASWRILGPNDDASRYWTAIGVYWDKNNVLRSARIGLTGLHIISKALPNWVWITFEQVDNPTATFKYFLGSKGAALGPNPNYDTSLGPLNSQYQQALAGTKWQYYALMKVQTDYADSAQQPILSSNTQMETYFQPKSSCISCHTLASIGNPKTASQSLRLQFFYPLNPYVGKIDFQQIANQQYPGEPFKAMDFAWSLRNAHPLKLSAAKATTSAGQ
jgi:hypothetical protein